MATPVLPPASPDTTRLHSPLARVLPFGAMVAFIVIASLPPRLQDIGWAPLLDDRWLYPAKITLVAALLWIFRKHYGELGRTFPRAPQLFVAILAGLGVFIAWIHLDLPWLRFGTSEGFDPTDPGGQINWGWIAVRIFGAALVVPLAEELFWRSFVARWIDNIRFWAVTPSQISARSLLITSALFASSHNLWFAGLVAGLVYGYLYIRSGTLWVPILAHAVTNGLLGIWVVMTGTWRFW